MSETTYFINEKTRQFFFSTCHTQRFDSTKFLEKDWCPITQSGHIIIAKLLKEFSEDGLTMTWNPDKKFAVEYENILMGELEDVTRELNKAKKLVGFVSHQLRRMADELEKTNTEENFNE